MNTKYWTYGCEHEFGDWLRSKPLPKGFKVDERDVTIVNSNGIAADPKGRLYGYGGEINTPPSTTPEDQCWMLQMLVAQFQPVVNYRSNLHIHIRVPGLGQNLELLKRLQQFNYNHLASTLHLIEPLPTVSLGNRLPRDKELYSDEEYLEGAKRRLRRNRVSHHTVLSRSRIENQLKADTIQQFLEAEVPRSGAGSVLWHCQPRAAVNLRQLRETDTIEFRHFPGTLNTTELLTAICWCSRYLELALSGEKQTPQELYRAEFASLHWPRFQPYEHWKEVRYRATVHDGTLKPEQILQNIKLIEEGKFEHESTNRLPR